MDDFQELIKDSVDATTIVSKADHKTELLVSNEHENLFEDSVKKAKNRLIVSSYKATSYVLTENLLKIIETKCKAEGVNFVFLFSLDMGHFEREPVSKLLYLERVSHKFPEKFIGKVEVHCDKNIHSKLLIVDDLYLVCGSANLLSNKKFTWLDFSIKSYDKKLISEASQKISNFNIQTIN